MLVVVMIVLWTWVILKYFSLGCGVSKVLVIHSVNLAALVVVAGVVEQELAVVVASLHLEEEVGAHH